jgi:hypothetical protein
MTANSRIPLALIMPLSLATVPGTPAAGPGNTTAVPATTAARRIEPRIALTPACTNRKQLEKKTVDRRTAITRM